VGDSRAQALLEKIANNSSLVATNNVTTATTSALVAAATIGAIRVYSIHWSFQATTSLSNLTLQDGSNAVFNIVAPASTSDTGFFSFGERPWILSRASALNLVRSAALTACRVTVQYDIA